MDFLIGDIGNTNTKICLIDLKTFKIKKTIFFNSLNINSHNFLKKKLNKIIIKKNIHKIALFSSVVPKYKLILRSFLKKFYKIKFIEIKDKNIKKIIKIKIANKKQVGSDRIANAVGVYQRYKCDCIVLDFGTATTFDVINAKGHFLGGAIATGLETSAQYLFNNAALLEKTSLIFPENIIGKNTAENIQSGIMYGTVGQVEGIIERIKIESSIQNYSIILTGGLSPLISKKIKYKHILDTDLTLKGIFEIYKQQN